MSGCRKEGLFCARFFIWEVLIILVFLVSRNVPVNLFLEPITWFPGSLFFLRPHPFNLNNNRVRRLCSIVRVVAGVVKRDHFFFIGPRQEEGAGAGSDGDAGGPAGVRAGSGGLSGPAPGPSGAESPFLKNTVRVRWIEIVRYM